MLDRPKYKVVLFSWAEKRQDLVDAAATLPAPLRAEATRAYAGSIPSSRKPLHCGSIMPPIHSKRSISRLRSIHKRARVLPYSKADRPRLGFHASAVGFVFLPDLSKIDFDRFLAAYLTIHPEWAEMDLGKPNIERSARRAAPGCLSSRNCRHSSDAHGHKIFVQMKIDDPEKEKSAPVVLGPQKMYLELTLPDAAPVVEISFSWFARLRPACPKRCG